ncbi:hypothetical protein FRB93_007659 [Tulasnella sp. JGI-2019a]|nr:hypothetical protein FRB93_007659 [Tulasnella sp. JGI-2019a]
MTSLQQSLTGSDGVIIEVATSFFPTAILPGVNHRRPDLILVSSDSVFFYCHRERLLSSSSNLFGNLLASPPSRSSESSRSASTNHEPHHSLLSLPTQTLQETGPVINVMLHVIYGLPYRRFAPTLAIMAEALIAMDRYGIAVTDESSELWTVVLHHAEIEPIRAYSIAASHNMESLCTEISQHTLGVSLATVTEGDALTMGPVYLRKLFFLHMGRAQALKRVIERPPTSHRPIATCSADDAAEVVSRWELAVASILVHPMAQNISTEELRDTLAAVVHPRMCPACFEDVRTRVADVIKDWDGIKRTI